MWETILKSLKAAAAIIGGGIGWYLGTPATLIYVMLAFCAVDYITGVTVAAIQKKLDSRVGFVGLARKVLIFLLIGIGNLIDVYVIGQGNVIRSGVIFFYLANEGLSILENAGMLGLPVPETLKKLLSQLKEDEQLERTDTDK